MAAVAAGGIIMVPRLLTGNACTGALRLSVAVASDIEPAIRQAAADWVSTRPRVGRRCVTVDIRAAEPADVASIVASQQKLYLKGLASASTASEPPDVWVPDSGIWLTRLRLSAQELPIQPRSLALSPVVLAVPESQAAALQDLTWPTLLNRVLTNAGPRLGVVDPSQDSAGLFGLLALRSAIAASPGDQRQATVGAIRALGAGTASVRQELLTRFARSAGTDQAAGAPGAAPMSEASVLQYDARQPAVPLVPLYLTPSAATLDYPFVVLPGAEADVVSAATQLGRALSGARFERLLAGHGLRTSDGTAGVGFPAGHGARGDAAQPPVQAPAAEIEQAISDWVTVMLPARLLVAIDISGSMASPVPTAGGATREAVTVESARRGISMCDDTFALGLWVFSTLLDGDRDHQELVPVQPLSANRAALMAALPTIAPKSNGMTGLYDTILAGYQRLLEDWDPTRVSTLIVMTDGKNEDPGGQSLDQLVGSLGNLIDKDRPVQIVLIGIGLDVSESELKKISAPTGGATFIAPDPSKVGEIFMEIMALRTGG